MDYIPCACHSLNLFGQSAVDCCVKAVSLIVFLAAYVHIFVASTQRWVVQLAHMDQKLDCLIPKNVSETRWYARADAIEFVFKGYQLLPSALEDIVSDDNQNRDSQDQANSLAEHMETMEGSFMY